MALSNYTELQTAIQTELEMSETTFTTAVPDLINRAESKLNRKLRLREMEQLAYATLTSSSRFLSMPNDYVELLNLRIREASQADTDYTEVRYVPPERLHEFYDRDTFYYTLRDQLEFNQVGDDHRVMMHFIKGWNIATDATNWLLTNYPDAYLYGALVEAEAFLRNDERIPLWKSLFQEVVEDLNNLSLRGRDDAELDISDMVSLHGPTSFNITTG